MPDAAPIRPASLAELRRLLRDWSPRIQHPRTGVWQWWTVTGAVDLVRRTGIGVVEVRLVTLDGGDRVALIGRRGDDDAAP